MSKFVLCICYPSFNRGKLLYPKIKEYLACPDQRFCITVQDNCSTNGTYELLSSIKDERFRLRQNNRNVGYIPNSQLVLSGNDDADYVVYSVDRDMLDIEYLPTLLDYLENNKPYFGLIDPHNDTLKDSIVYPAGIQSVNALAYKSRHPTGFFWRNDLLQKEFNTPSFKSLPPTFDFWFDWMMGQLGSKYPGTKINVPAIVHFSRSKPEDFKERAGDKTISYTSPEKHWFELPLRLDTFKHYVHGILISELSVKEKQEVCINVLRATMRTVSIELSNIHTDKWLRYHYGIERGELSWWKMTSNAWIVYRQYCKWMKGRIEYTPFRAFFCFLYRTASITKYWILRFFKKPKSYLDKQLKLAKWENLEN